MRAKCPTNFSLSRLDKEIFPLLPTDLLIRPRQIEVCRTFGAARFMHTLQVKWNGFLREASKYAITVPPDLTHGDHTLPAI
jgi:hypothetical protein